MGYIQIYIQLNLLKNRSKNPHNHQVFIQLGKFMVSFINKYVGVKKLSKKL